MTSDDTDSGTGFDKKAESDLIQLVYVSVANPGLTQDQIEGIAESSGRHNRRLHITGLLLHQGASFYGVLEGEKRSVFRRMEVIITDRRHREVQILREGPIRQRRFENWTFGAIPRGVSGTMDRMASEDFIQNLSRKLT